MHTEIMNNREDECEREAAAGVKIAAHMCTQCDQTVKAACSYVGINCVVYFIHAYNFTASHF